MRQLVMVGLVGLVCACGGRGGNGTGPPDDERPISFGKWKWDAAGKTYYSFHDSPSGGIIVLEQPAHVWRCNDKGEGCTIIDSCVTTTGPSLTGSSGPPPVPAPAAAVVGGTGSGSGVVACPQICDCMGADCRYYCGNGIIKVGTDERHLQLQLPLPTAP